MVHFSSSAAAALFVLFSNAGAMVAAQSQFTSDVSVICVAGQCVEGFTNLSMGAVLSSNDLPSSILLLPGQYAQDTNPQLLHQGLTSSSAKLNTSPGFSNSTTSSSVSLPLDVSLQPGLATYSGANYTGEASFSALSSNSTGQFSAESLIISSNTFASLSSGLILWDSIPDMSQLAASAIPSSNNLTLSSIQSTSCSTPCTSGGVCTAQGTCSCKPGFTGASCESCSSGFFGPSCSQCPAGCAQCDDGLTGSGRCLQFEVANNATSCNCQNGACGTNGQCACNPGWTNASNGTQCAACAQGFFLDSNGDCSVCSQGCASCADSSGTCLTCNPSFTQSPNDRTQCIPPTTTTTTPSGQLCPDGSFNNGTGCAACSPLCQTCTGPTSAECVICGAGRYALTLGANSTSGSTCVQTDANGVCEGSNGGLVADNNKRECEACPARCTTCGISGFNVASTIDQLQCTGCLAGFVLSQGKCVESCPAGTFLNPSDNVTCTACSSPCGTCAGSATFCLTCSNNQLASSGSCVTSCPASTFSSGGACVSCHPDCATCSGTSFNQCSSCPPSRPVLANGRCVPTCAKNAFFDTATGQCQNCDSSCSSCSGAGPGNCLACSSTSNVLRSGTCTQAQCAGGTSVVQGLGACLSDLVVLPAASGTASGALPSLTGLTSPTVIEKSGKSNLEWWQILLMALGCAFIVLLALMCLRRRMRKKRAQATLVFARTKGIESRMGWRARLKRLFGFGSKKKDEVELAIYDPEAAYGREKAFDTHSRHSQIFMDVKSSRSGASSSKPKSKVSRVPVPVSDMYIDANRMSTSDASFYTEVTGVPRRGREVRQPVRDAPRPGVVPIGRHARSQREAASRYSSSSYSSFTSSLDRPETLPDLDDGKTPTPAQEYMRSLQSSRRDQDLISLASHGSRRGEYWLKPSHTGSSSGSRNPFRQ